MKLNKFGFGFGVIVVVLLVMVSAFLLVGNKITGFVTGNQIKNIDSLSSLSPGNYFLDSKGIVYSIDNSNIAVAKVSSFDKNQIDKAFYVDNKGNIWLKEK